MELVLFKEVKHPQEHRSNLLSKHSNLVELHGHTKYPQYPLIQFKNFNKKSICMNLTHHKLTHESINFSMNLNLNITLSESVKTYRFLTPYIPTKDDDTSINIENRLRNHIISMCRALEVPRELSEQIKVSITNLDRKAVTVKTSNKDLYARGYFGVFTTNLNIPDYIGIGNYVSKGFGTVEVIS